MASVQMKQVLFLVIILISFLILFGILIYTSSAGAAAEEDAAPVKRKMFNYENSSVTINADESLIGDVLVRNGSLTVAGELRGHIIAINADVYLEQNSHVYGHVFVHRGEVVRNEPMEITGWIIQIGDEQFKVIESAPSDSGGLPLTILKSDTMLASDATIYGDVLVLRTGMTIQGKIDGDVVNFWGKTIVLAQAAIDGNVICYGGQLVLDNSALITGRALSLGPEQAYTKQQEEDKIIQEKIERKYLKHHKQKDSGIVRFWGDVVIEPDEFIRGDVVTLRGTVRVKGEVDGSVVALFGNVELDSTAQVTGDVVSVGGKIYRSRLAKVNGDMVQTTITGVKVDDGDQHVSVGIGGVSVGPKRGDEWERPHAERNRYYTDSPFESEPFMFRYNRVEGLFLGLKLERDDWRDRNKAWFDLYGHAGYGFSRKRACYQIGVERNVFGKYGPVVGAEAHDVVHSEDEWMIPTFENSLAALFLREDFHDYFRRSGYSAYISHDISEYLVLTAAYRWDHHYNLKRKTQWSIFGGDKKFRENPLIDEIDFQSAAATITLDTRNDYKYPDQGWLIDVTGEFAGKRFKNLDVDFDRFIVDLRRYQPITHGENLDFRVRVGSSRGKLPSQLQFDLGGLSTLRGYRFKEFANDSATTTNRMLLGNIEYRIHGRRSPLNQILGWSDFSLILFADAGLVWSVDDSLKAQQGFDHLDWEDLYTAIGFGLGNREGNVRLDFAKRMDRKGEPLVVTFRINRPF
ncbi:MAG: DUF5686 family protein [candidate division KSB1 bacterium]|nr:DUF5686 family protein [candidate division KSB1 bacterium]MDZ7358685.1 DUF5686 family protein [candidate division KSB1 bacterium]